MLQISQAHLETMLAQLQTAYPLEACGLLAGQEGEVQKLYPVENRLASAYAYEMDPSQQLAAMIDLEERGWELLAIYHSHPHGPETPSATDIARSFYPEAAQVIVSLQDRRRPSVRAFRIAGDRVTEIPIRVV